MKPLKAHEVKGKGCCCTCTKCNRDIRTLGSETEKLYAVADAPTGTYYCQSCAESLGLI